MSATTAVCKAVQNVLCFIAWNAVYCGKQCAERDQLDQAWTNYNSLVDDFFSKRGKWKYRDNYDIKNAMVSAGIEENSFTIDRDNLFSQTKNKKLVADNVKTKGNDMRKRFKIWLDDGFFNWTNFKKHFDLKGSSIITSDGDDEHHGDGCATFIVEHSGWGNSYEQIPDDLVDQFMEYHIISSKEIVEIDADSDDEIENIIELCDNTNTDNNTDNTDTGIKRKRVPSKVKRRNVPTKFEHLLAFLYMFYFPVKEGDDPDAFVADLVTKAWMVKYREVSLEDATDKSARSRSTMKKELTANSLKTINATNQKSHEDNHIGDVNVLKLNLERKGLNDDIQNHLSNQEVFIEVYGSREVFIGEVKKKYLY